MLLAGDIGATNCRLAFFDENLTIVHKSVYKCKDYKNFEEVVSEFISSHDYQIEKACFGIPGPIKDGQCKLTNVPWTIDAKLLAQVTNSSVALLNDVEANAYGLETLQNDELVTLNDTTPLPGGNRAIIAVGTSVGEAALINVDGRIYGMASEGGHRDFGPFNELQWELLRYTQRRYQRVSYEVLLGGQGLIQMYDFLRDSGYGVTPPWLVQEIEKGDKAAAIANAALENKCDLCAQAMDLFISVLAAQTGNVAVTFTATGGIYLGGGIPPRIAEKLRQPMFLENFINKDKMRDFLRSIPVYIILNDQAALQGAAWYAQKIQKN